MRETEQSKETVQLSHQHFLKHYLSHYTHSRAQAQKLTDHQIAGRVGEVVAPSIDQRLLQLPVVDAACVVFVDVAENVLDFRIDGRLLRWRCVTTVTASVPARCSRVLSVASILLLRVSSLLENVPSRHTKRHN